MRCWMVRRLLSDYMDNELPEGRYSQVKEHLDRCQKCLQLLREYEAVTDIVVGVWKLEKQNLPNEEQDIIWGKVQAGIAVFKKRKSSMKMKISKWISEHFRIYQPKIEPAIPGFAIIVFFVFGFLFLEAIQSRQPTLLSPKVRITTPNARIEAGGDAHLYLNPEEDGSTRIGVSYAYDTISVLTKRSNINLISGTTAYVYPDGTVSKPEKISEVQLKEWQDKLEGGNI